MTSDVTEFGVLLRACRRAVGLSEEERAEGAARSTQAISGLECGRARCPHWQLVCRLANALDLRDQIAPPRARHNRATYVRLSSRASLVRR
jgi:transcriptional regulator with XRE-family HTH domain